MRCLRPLSLALILTLATIGTASALRGQTDRTDRQPDSTRDLSGALQLRALRAEPGKPSLYELSFTTSDTLTTSAEIVLEFPASFDLSLLEIASSTTINGGFKITRTGNTVRVRRTGLGDPVPPGRQVELKLGLIRNPDTLSVSQTVTTEILASAQSTTSKKRSHSVQFISR